MSEIKKVLMERDGMSEDEAIRLIEDAKEQLQAYLADDDQDAAEDICAEYFGLEPDYIMELL